ncbi:molybdenum cofactor biosynthesis protein MoaE, partial [Aegicerativicinus sediminis]
LIEEIKEEYQLHEVQIFHSLGIVPAGEICFVVFASSKHRKGLFNAVEILAKRFKSEVPIFGKELFQDKEYRWKVNM